MRPKILIVSVALMAGGITLFWQKYSVEPIRVSGTIEADEIRVGSRVGGRVREVLVREGQTVRGGEVLVRLEPMDLQDRLAEAQALRSAAQATYERILAGYRPEEIRQAEAQFSEAKAAYEEALAGPRRQEIDKAARDYELAQAELEQAQLDLNRAESLYNRSAVPKSDWDKARTKFRVTQARASASKALLEMLREGTRAEVIEQVRARLARTEAQWMLMRAGSRAEDIHQAKAQLEAAQAAVRVIETQLTELEVKAPAPSLIEAVDLQPGDLVTVNAPILTLIDRRRLWLRAYVPETLMARFPPGAEVTMSVDGFPGRRFRGSVGFVAHQAEFTPSNAQTPDERGKQVFRIKIQFLEGLDDLRPGMGADLHLGEGGVLYEP